MVNTVTGAVQVRELGKTLVKELHLIAQSLRAFATTELRNIQLNCMMKGGLKHERH
jgi:hypothetical protein